MKKKDGFSISIDRSSREPLSDQIVNSIKAAVDEGRLREGDRIPSREKLVEDFGFSMRVPREAFRRLQADGYIVARPRLGSVVAKPKKGKKWKGIVVYAGLDVAECSYAEITMISELRRRLVAAGYFLLRVGIHQKTSNSYDFSEVERTLRFGVSLVVVGYSHPRIRGWFERASVPFVIGGGAPEIANCVGNIGWNDSKPGLAAFSRHCQAAKVRTLLQVGFSFPGSFFRLPPDFGGGLRSELWKIPPAHGVARPDGICFAVRDAFRRRLKSGRDWLPDLLFFADDYVMRGAVAALAEAGVRIPEDVKVVSCVNEGNRFGGAATQTALVRNQRVRGRLLAEGVLRYFAKREFVEIECGSLRYEIGESFPRV